MRLPFAASIGFRAPTLRDATREAARIPVCKGADQRHWTGRLLSTGPGAMGSTRSRGPSPGKRRLTIPRSPGYFMPPNLWHRRLFNGYRNGVTAMDIRTSAAGPKSPSRTPYTGSSGTTNRMQPRSSQVTETVAASEDAEGIPTPETLAQHWVQDGNCLTIRILCLLRVLEVTGKPPRQAPTAIVGTAHCAC